jgi:hypothetical protein
MLRAFASPRVWVVLLLSFPAVALGQATTAPVDASTPKGALHLADATIPEGGMDTALKFYHATSARDRELARCSAGVDVACSHLEEAVLQKFGRQTADDAIHILGSQVGSDIDAATEKVDGAKALIQWKGEEEPMHMIRVGGDWKVDLTTQLQGMSEQSVAQYAEFLKHLAVGADRMADQVTSGKLATAKDLLDACKAEHEKLLKMNQ